MLCNDTSPLTSNADCGLLVFIHTHPAALAPFIGTLIKKLPALHARKLLLLSEFHTNVLLYQIFIVRIQALKLCVAFFILLLYHPGITE